MTKKTLEITTCDQCGKEIPAPTYETITLWKGGGITIGTAGYEFSQQKDFCDRYCAGAWFLDSMGFKDISALLIK